MINQTIDTSNLSDIKDHFLNVIAPNYFNLDNVNNYQSGIFGYINEIQASAVEDVFSAVAIARREFYPVTAQYISSLNNMAALQGIEARLVTPAYCEAALVVLENEIVENGEITGDTITYTIDNVLRMQAEDLQFMLDYPIKILSRKTDKWTHTVYYDSKYSNSLDVSSSSRYISTKVVNEGGLNYLILFVGLIRQVTLTQESFVMVKDSLLETYTHTIDFEGDLANFEVFYLDPTTNEDVQLSKILGNSNAQPKVPYVKYEIVNDNKIKLIFAYNTVFIPQFNSEIKVKIYTSKGTGGNFESFGGDLQCSSDSDLYPHNSSLSIVGRINGSSVGGKDKPSIDDYRTSIIRAYSTNNTITTSNDLQIQFDAISDSIEDIKVLFIAKRDDVFDRLYNAFLLVKESGGNLIPSNTLDLNFRKTDYLPLDAPPDTSKIIISPGTLFTYESSASFDIGIVKDGSGNKMTIWDLPDDGQQYFTNPYLIIQNISPNVTGYYLNSTSTIVPVEYKYINNLAVYHFIGRSISISRNSIRGENFYRISLKLVPTIDIEVSDIITIAEDTDPDYQILAKYNGRIVGNEYYNDPVTDGVSYIRTKIQYYDVAAGDDEFIYIQSSNSAPFFNTPSVTGYKISFPIGYEFVKNDVLATKRVSDKGRLHIVGDLNTLLYVNGIYIPFAIEDYDETLKSYELSAYLATNDDITADSEIVITDGLYTSEGIKDQDRALPMDDLELELSVLYNNSGNNLLNKYSSFKGLEEFTLSNIYNNNVGDDNVYFMRNEPYIRSVSSFSPTDPIVNQDFLINITKIPLLGAEWCTVDGNYDYFVSKYSNTYENIKTVANNLENNFSITMAMYNTYGKSRFYIVGNNQELEQLDDVKISMRFGVRLLSLDNTEFIVSFRNYIKAYIENTSTVTIGNKDIYILNMLTDVKNTFPEIEYIEYYGFNKYDHMAQKIIGPDTDTYYENFVPEFLNIKGVLDSEGLLVPDIEITLLST